MSVMLHWQLPHNYLASTGASGALTFGRLEKTYHGQIVSRVNEICDSYVIPLRDVGNELLGYRVNVLILRG
jgi:hypothetical protein